MPRIIFEHEAEIPQADPAQTILEISLASGIQHVHACGGNARCSTCRVMVLEGIDQLAPRNAAERSLARKKGLEDNIRLACQTRVCSAEQRAMEPTVRDEGRPGASVSEVVRDGAAPGPVRLRRLVIDDDDVEVALATSSPSSGREARLAILFSDIRGFTKFAAGSLPYDVVHILNRYFRDTGNSVLRHGGHIDKYIGDGLMALFGLTPESSRTACHDAVSAALDMIDSVVALNRYLERHFQTAFRIGIGVHVGDVVVGSMGHPQQMQFSAIGDAVNIASRIESANKEAQTCVLVSTPVYEEIREDFLFGQEIRVALKGLAGIFVLHEVIGRRTPCEDIDRRLWRELDIRIHRTDAPQFLRLFFHAAMGQVPGAMDMSSGPLRTSSEIVLQVKRLFPQIDVLDITAMAGAVGIAKSCGPYIPIPIGADPILVARPADVEKLPGMAFPEIKKAFLDMGFTTRDFVALCGAHTLGRANSRPMTADLFTFSNSFFQVLTEALDRAGLEVLITDQSLVGDEECRRVVVEYAASQERFFADFTAAYQKMAKLRLVN